MKSIESSSKAKVLFVSHTQQLCGVHEFGLNVAAALQKSARYSFVYAECSSADELLAKAARENPVAIIYNYYFSTMPWLKKKIMRKLNVRHIGIMHEVTQQKADDAHDSLFQFHIAPDPSLLLKNPIVFKTGRLVPAYDNIFQPPSIPTIGSFGFGTKGKGFENLITTVQREFDEADIRFHIPFAAFGDATGSEAKAISERCRKLITKPRISLRVSHEFMTQQQLLDFLAQNTINAFFYEENKGRGISSVIDLALAVNRPIAITGSKMFRHVFSAMPSICVRDATLKQIIQNGTEPLKAYRDEWCERNLIWDYERIIDQVTATPPANPSLRGSPVSRPLSSVLGYFRRSPALQQAVSWIPQIHKSDLRPAVRERKSYSLAPLPGQLTLNRILDNSARELYAPIVSKLFEIVPDMMAHKIPEANVQQAFVLDTVYKFAAVLPAPKLLCIGSYDDTAAASLTRLGFRLEEIDPVLNYDLNTFFHKPTTTRGTYDIVFSTSVIEHVKDDELFISQIVDLLAPGGVAVLTCDFNDQYKSGDPLPREDFRFYTQADFEGRFLPLLNNCSLVGEPHWECPSPDFTYAGCHYTFATFVFSKNR